MIVPFVLPAIVGAKALSSGKDGGGGGGAADVQSRIAQQLFQETDPLRRSLIDRSAAYLDGGVQSSPVYEAFKATAEPQFAQARDQIIANTPRGGALIEALSQNENARARTLTQAQGAIDEAEIARAMGLATGQTGTALSGLGQAASIQAAQAQAEADREAGLLGALGTGAGAYFGSKS